MKKIILAAALSAALLLGACSTTKLSGDVAESANPTPGGVMSKDAALGIETDKTSYENRTEDSEGRTADSVDSGVPQGITVNIVKFEVLDGNIPDVIKTLVEANKGTKGYIAKEYDGSWYVAVFMGEQVTGGYSVEVSSIEDNEGKTIITVNEQKPADDAIVTMALSYPVQVVKITSGIAPNFTVVNQDGEEYPEVK